MTAINSARSATVSSRFTYPALDGLRALAVTLVFVEHFGGGSHGGRFLKWFNHVRLAGSSGVSLFFVLSGFLITGILYDTLHDKRFFRNFYARRSLRIFPIFYLILAVCAVLTPVLHYNVQWGHLSFLFYLGNVLANWNWSLYELVSPTHPALSINMGHFWSLFVEEQFYLIWPVVIFLVRDRVKLIRLSLAVILAVLALRIGMVLLLPIGTAEQFAFRMLPTRADDLLIGALMALLLRGPAAGSWLRRAWYFFAGGTAGFCILALSRGYFGFQDPYNLTIGLTLISMASAGLIALCIQERTWAFRLLSIRPFRRIGKYSYGFYVYHVLFNRARIAFFLFAVAYFHSLVIGGLVYVLSCYLVVFAVAALSYEFYEKRFLALKSHFQSSTAGTRNSISEPHTSGATGPVVL